MSNSIDWWGSSEKGGGYNPGIVDYGMKGFGLGMSYLNSKYEKEKMEELLGLKKDETYTNLAMKEANAYDSYNTRNRNLNGWKFNADNPNATDDQQRAALSQRIGDYNRNDLIVDVNGGQTDLIPNGIIPGQYQRQTANGAPNGLGTQYGGVPAGTSQPAIPAGTSQATVAATPARPMTRPGNSSAMRNKNVRRSQYVG